jgi:glycosyltransferase involved in cell wall biosynthesis
MILFFVTHIIAHPTPSRLHFFVVIPTYHNKEYCLENIETLASQTYQDWTAIIVVDGNQKDDDGTGDIVEKYINDHALNDKVIIHRNHKRRGALYNIYHAIHRHAHDNWVIVLYDGDDFFYTDTALERIAQEYSERGEHDTWFTYGQYINYPDNTPGHCHEFPQKIIRTNNFRSYPWIASHPITFYAWLFKKIHKKDLQHDGKFFKVAWDVAFMPMLEMASGKHMRFIPDILYAYRHHERNDYNLHYSSIPKTVKIILGKKRYKPLIDIN